MKIFYIDIDKFKKKYDKTFLEAYADIELKTEKRFYEYTIGRYLVKYAAENFFGLKNTEIVINEKGKPVFKYSDLHFSISHSRNYVMVCIDGYNCGIDIEYIKQRNFEHLGKYFKRKFDNTEDFYKFWTQKEAKYKLHSDCKDIYSEIFNEKYYLTVVSESEIGNVSYTELQ